MEGGLPDNGNKGTETRVSTGNCKYLSVAIWDETGEADQTFRGLVCYVKSLDFILMAMGKPWKIFKQGSDTPKTTILDISELAEKYWIF